MTSIFSLFKTLKEKIDIPFLLFLITISPNKVYLKIFALLFIFFLRPRFDFFFSKKISLFYPVIIIISILQFLFLSRDFSINHTIVFLVGLAYWLVCYCYMYQTYLFVSENNLHKVHKTIVLFVLINGAVCFINYFKICVEVNSLWPFLIDNNQYGASTGDHITGLFGRPSYINAMVNSLFSFYFISNKKTGLFIFTSFLTILSFANIINLIFIGILILYFLISNDTKKRLLVLLSIFLSFFMYVFVSPQNFTYMKKTLGLSMFNETEIMPEVIIDPKPNVVIASTEKSKEAIKYVNDSSAAKQKVVVANRNLVFNTDYSGYMTYKEVDIKSSPGKKIAILQTLEFLKEKKTHLFFGAGMGNFSSRLAYQFSGRDSSRLFMRMPKYANGYYFKNNLLIYDSMKQLPDEYHSIKHFPNNFLSQILGEYGFIGCLVFLVFYIGFFYKNVESKLFFITILFCILGYLMLDYLFEFFNIMLIFELLLFIEIKKKQLLKEGE